MFNRVETGFCFFCPRGISFCEVVSVPAVVRSHNVSRSLETQSAESTRDVLMAAFPMWTAVICRRLNAPFMTEGIPGLRLTLFYGVSQREERG